ncbi:hypothetical protein PABG_07544 [Paracoccidioides brasiliensis Pb03]|nr:hypothetical protein PABG_07544 [Paracoccidioides brasiliensis Pb03]
MPHHIPHTLVSLATEYQVSQAHKEPLAVQQRKYLGAHRIIFWYLAKADSMETPAVGDSGKVGRSQTPMDVLSTRRLLSYGAKKAS